MKKIFNTFFLLIALSINVEHVSSYDKDVLFLRDHFIQNLLEENRKVFDLKLTDEIENSINTKIDAFLHLMDEPHERHRRDTNDLLLIEQSK
jgi:hypothetical protein